jgi:hypothetical protein
MTAVRILKVVAGLAVVCAAGAAQAAPITNGSFETGDYTGWTLSENSGFPDYGT